MSEPATETMHLPTNNTPSRLFFLDWVRIIAFLLLILYHVGMYYVTWDWHVKSPKASSTVEPLMLMLSPWRLSLLFLVSGVAATFILNKPGNTMGARSMRLLVPLVVGMFVVIPPQSYLEVVEKGAYAGSYLDFLKLYLSAYGGFCRDGECLILPTWNHLWFVAYLWVYTLLLWCLIRLPGLKFVPMAERLSRWLAGWRLIVYPFMLLVVMRALLEDRFPPTHALADDWYNHSRYGTLFLLGAAVARSEAFWLEVRRLRRVSLAVSLTCLAVLMVHMTVVLPEVWRSVMPVFWTLYSWSAILTICGYAYAYLNRDAAARRYLTEAMFPVYIFHQTIIIVLAHGLQPLELSTGIEAPMLVPAALAGSLALFELVRRVTWLRPLFGLGTRLRKDRPAGDGLRPLAL